MRWLSGLDSELFAEVPPPIAMAVPTVFYFYKVLSVWCLRQSRNCSSFRFRLRRGIAVSRLRDVLLLLFRVSFCTGETRSTKGANRMKQLGSISLVILNRRSAVKDLTNNQRLCASQETVVQ